MGAAKSEDLYTAGGYMKQHPDWHLSDAPNKAVDILPGLLAAIQDRPDPSAPFKLTDVGAGVGGVLDAAITLLKQKLPSLNIEPIAMEISPQAVEKGRALFPHLLFLQEPLAVHQGPFDAIVLADVLEHLDNPREMLRLAGATASHLVIRQPLLDSFGTFRLDGYGSQRKTWGHVGFFNYRSLWDMMIETGWEPLTIRLTPPWELHNAPPGKLLQRLVVKANRVMGSYIVSGFYLNGCFKRCATTADAQQNA